MHCITSLESGAIINFFESKPKTLDYCFYVHWCCRIYSFVSRLSNGMAYTTSNSFKGLELQQGIEEIKILKYLQVSDSKSFLHISKRQYLAPSPWESDLIGLAYCLNAETLKASLSDSHVHPELGNTNLTRNTEQCFSSQTVHYNFLGDYLKCWCWDPIKSWSLSWLQEFMCFKEQKMFLMCSQVWKSFFIKTHLIFERQSDREGRRVRGRETETAVSVPWCVCPSSYTNLVWIRPNPGDMNAFLDFCMHHSSPNI